MRRHVDTQAIEALPPVQSPEVFGLHANADIQYYTTATRALWRDLLDLAPGSGGGGAADAGEGGAVAQQERLVSRVADDILARLPPPFDLAPLRRRLGVPSPTQVVLLQELARWNMCVSSFTSRSPDPCWRRHRLPQSRPTQSRHRH